jgi:AraC-like DNA-binding protein
LNETDYLSLRQTRLNSPEELEFKAEALYFLFGRAGSGKFSSPRASHRLAAGEIVVVNNHSGGKVTAENKGEIHFSHFSLSFENLLPLFGTSEISRLHVLTENLKAGKNFPARLPLATECQKLLTAVPAEFDLNHRGQLLRIAASILANEFKAIQAQHAPTASPDEHVARVFEKLSATELINLSVSELAARFNCSRRHLNRLFHQHFGVSVATLRMEMRLLKAVSLLRDAGAKIINVAEQCGFNHLGLFNTCFKRRFGVSPGQWRKSGFKAGENPAPAKSGGKTGSAKLSPLLDAVAGKIDGGSQMLVDLQRRKLLATKRSKTA